MSEHSTNEPTPEILPSDRPAPGVDVPPLRREAIYVTTDPRRFAGVAAVTALAGVTIGFALALLAQPSHHCPGARVRVQSAELAPVIAAKEDRTTWLGVEVSGEPGGARVRRVIPSTAAERAGLRPGDLIERLDSQPIRSGSDLVYAVRSHAEGDPVSLGVIRLNKEPAIRRRVSLNATLGSVPSRALANGGW